MLNCCYALLITRWIEIYRAFLPAYNIIAACQHYTIPATSVLYLLSFSMRSCAR